MSFIAPRRYFSQRAVLHRSDSDFYITQHMTHDLQTTFKWPSIQQHSTRCLDDLQMSYSLGTQHSKHVNSQWPSNNLQMPFNSAIEHSKHVTSRWPSNVLQVSHTTAHTTHDTLKDLPKTFNSAIWLEQENIRDQLLIEKCCNFQILDLDSKRRPVRHTDRQQLRHMGGLAVVLRGTTVLPRHRATIFLQYQYCRLYGTF